FSHTNIIANVDAKGVLVSTNSGAAWTQINTGLYKGNTQSLSTTILSGDTLIAGNSEGGVFIRSLSQAGITSVDRIDAVTPAQYALEQNYPNPFNPSTTIRYHVAVPGDVQLTVYDAIGREVSTLVRGYAPAGTYAVTFSGSGLPSGMYLYRLQTASGVAVRRMLLVK
ncbi:MAG: T9SS type A sorting domain-containing protein, partial [Bacteroidetes bacterium]|nr:T9SS type A sorting domain-containing protein [Bacteroidota bacterium]